MTKHITIRNAAGTWSIRAAGAVLGESKSALELSEGDLPPVIYFPRSDLAMALLEANGETTHCPHKGDAIAFDLHAKSGVFPNAAWSYETPKDAVSEIAGYVAFYTDKVTVEQI